MKQQINKPKSTESEAKSDKFAKFFSDIFDYSKNYFSTLKVKMRDLTKTNLELGKLHLRGGYLGDAITRFKLLITVKKDIPEAYYYLGMAYYLSDRKKDSESNFRKAMQLKPDFEECKYMLAKFDSNIQPTKISTEFVQYYMNEHSYEYYDKFILEKEYVGAEKLIHPIIDELKAMVRPLNILELGCGIGMSGDFIWRNSLDINEYIGVDLSENLIDIASHLYDDQNQQVYTNLICQDLREYLAGSEQKFDLILAPGSFDYVDDLASAISLSRSHLAKNGILAFYVEQAGLQERELDKTRMHFSYSRAFLESALNKAGLPTSQILEIAIDSTTKGWAVVIRG